MGQRTTLGRLTVRLGMALAGTALCVAAFTGCSAPSGTGAGDSGSGTQNTDPQPTKTVPAPSGGSTEETVAPVDPGPTQNAELGTAADLQGGVSITVSRVELLDVEATTPGEIAGPAVALTVDVVNGSDAAIDLSTAMVSATGSAGSYGQATTSPPYAPFTGSVEPGQEASGVYVFRLPADERGSLQVSVEYIAGAPVALFVGSV